MPRQIISTDEAPAAIGTYSQAVKVGSTVYLSGQIPLDPATMQLVEGGIDVQIRRVFANLAAVARAAGGSLADTVKLNVFLTDLSYFALVNQIMADHLFRTGESNHGRSFPRAFSRPSRYRRRRLATRSPGRDGRRADVGELIGGAHGLRRNPGWHKTRWAERRPIAGPRAAADHRPEPLPIIALPGVGPRLAERLRRLGIHNAEDVLLHLPLRYQDRSRITPIGQLIPGAEAQIEAEIIGGEVTMRGRRFLVCRLRDTTGTLVLRFFHFSPTQQQLLCQPGVRLRCFGEVRQGYASLEMVHPECRRLDSDTPSVAARLTPVYPSTAGLQQFTLRTLAEQALAQLDVEVLLPELLPHALRMQLRLPSITEATRLLHQPPSDTPLAELDNGRHPARRRVIPPGAGWHSRNCWLTS